ncbi:Predicted acyltransferase [Granulicella pectinivorans]|uniref:Predicted acyltransferase n=1 Tax=Granulicella pectinivorans TaxID=474950 RepID=A0A1I6MHE9_9BACT|nr:heparan-alpha-glucosaminide N-acetyltransferase domain-containing protein [Granulicella pectinivorans]SFS15072.1 Predicted acyltransferase [Granulicella pectinivorans]
MKRVLSIDVLRGVTIAFMILVNDPGDWLHVYAQLDHAVWNGWTLTDLVFPTFLFLVGASTVFSLDARIAKGNCRKTLAGHIFLRALKIFALKMALTIVPYFHMTHLRIYGVLTRIALCYLIGGLILLATRNMRVLAALSAAILAGYWALMRFVPIPGIGRPMRDVPFLDMNNNLAAWLDRAVNDLCQRTIHTGVLYEHTRDPEGLLSTLPAVATVLIGAMAGLWLKQHFAAPGKARNGLILGGFISFAAGLAWNPWFPINKNLWTSSYVLMAAGWALFGLGVFFWLIDVQRLHETRIGHWLTKPALIFGSNAITAYAMSAIIVKTLAYFKVQDGDKLTSVSGWIYHHLFASTGSTDNTSLAFAIVFVAVCFIPNWILYRKHIFLKL